MTELDPVKFYNSEQAHLLTALPVHCGGHPLRVGTPDAAPPPQMLPAAVPL